MTKKGKRDRREKERRSIRIAQTTASLEFVTKQLKQIVQAMEGLLLLSSRISKVEKRMAFIEGQIKVLEGKYSSAPDIARFKIPSKGSRR
jgi:hypothetical protein